MEHLLEEQGVLRMSLFHVATYLNGLFLMRISLEVFLQGKLSKAAAASSSNSAARLLALWPYVGDQAFWHQLAPSPVRHIKTGKKKKSQTKTTKKNHLLTLGLATLRERFILLSKLSWGYPLPLMPWLPLGVCCPCPGGVRCGGHWASSPYGWPDHYGILVRQWVAAQHQPALLALLHSRLTGRKGKETSEALT